MPIVWTISARKDVNAIWDFIEQRNPDAAELVNSEILRAVEGLLQFPKRGNPGRAKGTRELVVTGLPSFCGCSTARKIGLHKPLATRKHLLHLRNMSQT